MIRSHDHAAGPAARTLAHRPTRTGQMRTYRTATRARLAFNGTDGLANLAREVPIGRLTLDDSACRTNREPSRVVRWSVLQVWSIQVCAGHGDAEQ
jgi:hypothetical protein